MSRLISFIRASWKVHPLLTGAELLLAVILVVELIFLLHMAAGALVGAVTRNPDAFSQVRFVLMTAEDAQFGLSIVGLLGQLPAALFLATVSGIGWVHAGVNTAPTAPFIYGLCSAVGTLVLGVVFASLTNLGGGIIPH